MEDPGILSEIFAMENIRPGDSPDIISNKIPELESLGCKEGVGPLTVNKTRDLISFIKAHVSFSVSLHCYLILYAYHCFQTEAGCHLLINAIVLQVISNLSDAGVDVSIVPDFQKKSTQFEATPTSYAGFVDFLIVKGPPSHTSK